MRNLIVKIIIAGSVLFLIIFAVIYRYKISKLQSAKSILNLSKQETYVKDKGASSERFISPRFDRFLKEKQKNVTLGDLATRIENYLMQLEEICKKVDSIEGAMLASREQLQALKDIGEPAIPYLIENSYNKSNDWKLRLLLIGVLSSMKEVEGRKDVINLFSEIAEDATDKEDVRLGAVRGLRRVKDEDSFSRLNKILERDDEPVGLKTNIITTMSVLDEKKSIPVLVSQIQNNKDSELQLSAIASLDRLKSKEAIPIFIDTLKKVQTEEMLSGQEAEYQEVVKMHMISALGNIGIGNNEVENELINILKNKNEKIDVRISAAEALGNLKSANAVKSLLEVFQEKYGLMRIKTAEALAKIGDKAAIDKIKEYLKEENDTFVKGRIERCLEEIER